MAILNYIKATRLPFVTVSVLPVIIMSSWIYYTQNLIHPGFSLLTILGILFVHLGANTLNDYFDWERSDRVNKNPSPFNGGSRRLLEGIIPRNHFLILSLFLFGLSFLILLFFYC